MYILFCCISFTYITVKVLPSLNKVANQTKPNQSMGSVIRVAD